MEEKRQILCYGDSNTWGCIGRWELSELPSERYDTQTRWPCVLQRELGEEFHIIEEGLGGRTTIYVMNEPWKNGEMYLKPCLNSHRPLDLVVLMLGTNDLHAEVQPDEEHLGDGLNRLLDIIQEDKKSGRGYQPPKVLVLAPPEIVPSDPAGRVDVYPKFNCEQGRRLSLLFPQVYEQIARQRGCWYLNAAEYAKPGPADGVHLDAESHIRLGKAVAAYIRENIFPQK